MFVVECLTHCYSVLLRSHFPFSFSISVWSCQISAKLYLELSFVVKTLVFQIFSFVFYFAVLKQVQPSCVILSSKQDERLLKVLKKTGNDSYNWQRKAQKFVTCFIIFSFLLSCLIRLIVLNWNFYFDIAVRK